VFEALFKYPRLTFERGELLLASGWPIAALTGLLIAAAIGIAFNLRRHRAGLSLRRLALLWGLQTLLIGTVMLLLWQPALSIQKLRPQANSVALLLDTSGSMLYGEGDRTRLQQALDAIQPKLLASLRAEYDLKVYGFSRTPVPIDDLATLPPPGPVSYLGRSLHEVLREARTTPLGAVIIVSDGADNAAPADQPRPEELARHGVPVHAIGVGPEIVSDDIELTSVAIADEALPHSGISARVSIRHGGAATTRLRVHDGDTVLASQPIELSAGAGISNHRIDFDLGEPGVKDLRFSLDPIPAERNTINNTTRRLLNVPAVTRRALYVEGEPRWEYKFMRRANDGDAAVELVTLLRTSPNKFYRQGVDSPEELRDGFPTGREALFGFDALLIGSFEAAAFTPDQQQLIHDFVSERGGRLLLLGGRNALADGGWALGPVANALPVRLNDLETPTFHRTQVPVQLTPRGADAAITRLDPDTDQNRERWRGLPYIADYQTLGPLKPGAITLLEANVAGAALPLLVTQHYGRGATYVLATGGTWRWRMQLPHEDVTHQTFWRQLLRELVAGTVAPLQLSLDRALYADESAATVTAQLRDEAWRPIRDATIGLTITGDSGETRTAELRPVVDGDGLYQANVELPEPGVYRIDAVAHADDAPLGTASIHLLREDGVAEHFNVAQNRPLLERIAAATGGSYRDLDGLDGLLDAIRFSGAGIVETELLELWDMPAVFLLLWLLKGFEWALRLRWGRL
jgi:uncharacterized membrane protein